MKEVQRTLFKCALSFFLISFTAFVWNMESARAAASFEIAISNDSTATYNLGIGISSLVKVKLLPRDGVDLDTLVMSDDAESLRAVQDGDVDFALVTLDNTPLNLDDQVQTLGSLGKVGDGLRQLLVRREVSESIAQDILTTIFDGLDFLAAIEPQLGELDPDSAVIGLTLPLHQGAKRFYVSRWAAPSVAEPSNVAAVPLNEQPKAPTEPTRAPAPSNLPTDARNFVLYFGFDSDTLDVAANETLREAATFAGTLASPAVIIAAYTDSAGDADYNYLLAERRANSVMVGLERLGVRYSQIDLSLYGERSPWAVKLNDVREASNRRVELFIEEPVPEVQPLPTTQGTVTEPVTNQAITPAGRTDATRSYPSVEAVPAEPAGGPIQRLPTGTIKKPLM